MKLIKYRDAGMHTHTYFWVDKGSHRISPFFDVESDAMLWSEFDLNQNFQARSTYFQEQLEESKE